MGQQTPNCYIRCAEGEAVQLIKILIVDDHTLVREGLTTILSRQPDFDVVGEASDGVQAVDVARALHPDVILMDLRMPNMSGVEAMRRINAEDPDIKIIVLTTFDTDEYIFDAVEAGAKGYLLKDTSRDELFAAVRAVCKGESLIEPGVAARLITRFQELSQPDPDSLSDREVQVLQLVARGSANKQIAAELLISESTVKTHIANIFSKMNVRHRTQAVTQALQKGIIKL